MTKSILDEISLGEDTTSGSPVDAIRQVATERGINPDYLVGLATLETRLGDATIKGDGSDTRNLFNIKDFSKAGAGIRARDTAEGSNDRYRQYASFRESTEDLVDLLGRRYPGALDARTGQQFAESLKKGGYATDPNYVSKLTKVIGGENPVNAPKALASSPTSQQWLAGLTDEDLRGAGGLEQSRVMNRAETQAPKDTTFFGGLQTSVAQGAASAGRTISATFNSMVGDLTDVELLAEEQQAASAKDPRALQELQAEIKQRKDSNPDASAWQGVKDVAGAAFNNKEGLAQLIASQLPNTAVSLGGAYAGGKAGAIVGGAAGPAGALAGGIVGGLAGMFLGNFALEAGGKAIEKANDGYTEQESIEALTEGAKKAAVVTGVDAATFGATKLITRAFSGAAIKAGARAEAKVLADAGIDISDAAKIGQALTNAELRQAAKSAGEVAAKAASTTTRRSGNAVSGLAVETLGEGVGEYYGEELATGKGDVYDAALEAIASGSQSLVQTGLAMRDSGAPGLNVKEILKSQLDDQITKGNSPISRATVASAPELKVDPVSVRVGEIEAAFREGGLLDKLGEIGQGELTRQEFLEALSIARNPNQPAAYRARAMESVEQAMTWLDQGSMPNDPANGTPYSADLVVTDQPTTDQATQAKSDLTSTGAPKFFDADTVDAEAVRVDNMIEGPRALPAPPSVPAATQTKPADAGFFTPGNKAEQADVAIESVAANATLSEDASKADAPVVSVGVANSPAVSAPAIARTQVVAPKVAVPTATAQNTGTAQNRKRKAQFGAMAAGGFNSVERRDEGFFLVNPTANEELRLDSPGDAQMARAVIAVAPPVVGANISEDWIAFHPASGTLSVPRQDMPQVKSEHRGAMVNFLAARGIKSRQRIEPATDLKPTQAEFSQAKVDQAKAFVGNDRAVLVSSDGYILDGHHQWLAKMQNQSPVKVMRLDAPIARLLEAMQEFPSAGMTKVPSTVLAQTGDQNAVRGDERGSASATGDAAGAAATVAGAGNQPGASASAGLQGDELRNTPSQGAGPRGRALRNPPADAQAALKFSQHEGRAIELADPANPLTQAVDSLLDVMAGLTGYRGIAVHDTSPAAFDGAAYKGRTFINVANPQMNVGQTIAHEFKHLTEIHPALKVLYDRMWDLIPAEARRNYFENYLKKERRDPQGNITRAQGDFTQATAQELKLLKDEMLADFMGQRFNDKAWLQQLAKEKPVLFANFVREWLAVLDNIIDALKGLMNRDGSRGIKNKDVDAQLKNYISELRQMKALATEVAVAWAEKNPGLAVSTGTSNIAYSARLLGWAQEFAEGKPVERVMDVSRAPSVSLRLAGVASADKIIIRDSTLRHISKRGRIIDPDLISRLPQLLTAPRATVVNYENENGDVSGVALPGHKKRYNVIVNATDDQGNPYLVAMQKTNEMIELVDIKTLLGKNNSLAYVLRAIKAQSFVWMPQKEVDRIKAVTSGASIARAGVSSGAQPGSAEQSSQRSKGIVFSDDAGVKMLSGGDWQSAGIEIGVGNADIAAALGVNFSARTDAEQEYRDVVAELKGSNSWMRAPNGERTKLTERQWVQVRTPAFKTWFGDWEYFAANGGVGADERESVSQVVDANGEPLVVYHGTDKGGFTEFKRPDGNFRGDLGIFTTDNESMASSYVRESRPQQMSFTSDVQSLEDIGIRIEEFQGRVSSRDVEDRTLYGYEDPDGEDWGPYLTRELATEDAMARFVGDPPEISTVYAAFLNIRNPGSENFEGATWSGERQDQWQIVVDGEVQYKDGNQFFDYSDALDFAAQFVGEDSDATDFVEQADDYHLSTDDVARNARKDGNDGAIIYDVLDDGGGSGFDMTPSNVFVAFEPNQLKSADFNTGEFGESGDIRYSERFPEKILKNGSLEVQGDVEEIRAAIPADILGRAIKGGILFSRLDAPRVSSALAGDSNAYSRAGAVVSKNAMRGGKYIGAPEKFNTPQKLTTLRKILMDLTIEGERGRFWYERSSEEILRMVAGDAQEARKFVALLAIYSPQARVDSNSTFALRAWSQYKAGQPISVKTKLMDNKAAKAMGDVDEFWKGEKTGNFFGNLLSRIDPATQGKQGATIDMWMMRAGQYSNDAPSKAQYAFMELETNRVAKELGWEPQQVQAAIWVAMKARMENTGVKRRTEFISEKKGWIRYDYPLKDGKPKKTRVVLDAQAHRDNWLKQAFAHDVTQDDTNQAKFDFADGVRRHLGQISFEARPGRTSAILPGIHSASYAQQTEFQQAVQAAFLEEDGTDRLAQMLGLLVDENNILSPGVWQGEVSPSSQKLVAMAPTKSTDTKSAVDPSQASALNVYAAVAGLVARQEGVGWHRPFYATTKTAANGLDIDIGRPLSPDEALALTKSIDAWMQTNGKGADWNNDLALISSPYGIRLVNFGGISNAELQTGVVTASEAALPDFNYRVFASDGDMPTNNWKENPNGQSYIQRIGAEGRPDVLEWARAVLAPRVQRVFEAFSDRYGWGDPGEIKFSDRLGASGRAKNDDGSRDSELSKSYEVNRQASGISIPQGDTGDGAARGDRGLASSAIRAQDAGKYEPLVGAPTKDPAKAGTSAGPSPNLVMVAEQYAIDNGINLRRQSEYVQVDEVRAKRLAQAYADMPHAPQNPIVKEAFENLIRQTTAQYRALEAAGYKFWLFDSESDPYGADPWIAMRDLREDKSMAVYYTAAGFGSSLDFDPSSNPLLADTGIEWPFGSPDGPRKPVFANDLFRAVHDAFGHGLEGAGFRARGEENAWQAHSRLFTGSALGAITTETRGQNSWLNFGPSGNSNQAAKLEDTVFADQKTGLMPEWTWLEGVAGDANYSERKDQYEQSTNPARELADVRRSGGLDSAVYQEPPRYGRPVAEASSATGYHFSKKARTSLNSGYYGTGLKGAEAERLSGSDNADIRPRVFFYVDKGNGVRAESGVGGYGHHVQLDNLYDIQKDALGLIVKTRGMPGDRANNWERAILDAGFDGYLHRDPVMPQGYAVLLGKKHSAVPVEQTQAPGAQPNPVVERRVDPQATKTEGGELVKKPNALELGQLANPARRAKVQEAAPSFKLQYGSFRVAAAQSRAADMAIVEFSPTFRFGEVMLSLRDEDALQEKQAELDVIEVESAPEPRKASRYATKKVEVPVKIEDTGEVAYLTMDVDRSIDDNEMRTANMLELLGCLT